MNPFWVRVMAKSYIYAWFNDDWGSVPVYVGKGQGNRFKSLNNRSRAFTAHVSRWRCHSEIIFDELSEDQAMRFEKALKDGFILQGYPILDAEACYQKKVSQSVSIAEAKARGIKFGRTKKEIDHVAFENLAQKQKGGLMTVDECCAELGIGRTTWYERLREVG